VLQALYAATGGKKWERKREWMSATPLKEWQGVAVNSSGRVTRLILSYSNLCGNIPNELSHLSSLEMLNLHNNNLSGNIPKELSQLRNLQYLYLNNNNLSGKKFLTAAWAMV